MTLRFSVRDRITIPPRISPCNSVPGGTVEKYCCSAPRDTEWRRLSHPVSARLQVLEDRVRKCGLEIQLVETCCVRPRRCKKMQRLDPGPFKRLVQIGVPRGPKLYDIQE